MTAAQRAFFPALEGVRAVAALGVLTTHVAFQTNLVDGSPLGAVLGRLDMAVAVFFALSGFLLWRPHAVAARGGPAAASIRRYFRHRVVRIWPAYVVVVVVVLSLLPVARGADLQVWLANLFLVQIYVPYTLTGGLTQMWSLAVEVSFYAVLPFVALGFARLRGPRARLRVPVLLGVGLLSLVWAPIAAGFPLTAGVSATGWLPGHLPWFVAGMVLAELSVIWHGVSRPTNGVHRLLVDRRVMLPVALVLYVAACTPLAGPTGLDAVSSSAFVGKMVLGALLGFALLAPLVLAPPGRSRWLESAPMQALGRWSYAIFIWHLAVLSVVFALFGFASGAFWLIWPITVVLSVAVAAASYGFIEEPARQWLRAYESRRSQRRSGQAADANTTLIATSAGS
ncbi:acyltransferase [Williamsia sp. CHRR-6]|uniref:acyltransferase family protein n=1 Tax=Williamsia sp. CHRR-6 TaxID=2835871 RepID=UPI001BDA5465|nr:acyltransferase [Williamsia sp. CHRR-6]MBT0567473.1 acyltransferase [Williamsia sp. CHRR-6]